MTAAMNVSQRGATKVPIFALLAVNITSGMRTDGIESARGGTEHLDSRAQNEAVQPLSTTWAFVGQSTTQTIRAKDLHSNCDYTLLEGRTLRGRQPEPCRGRLLLLLSSPDCSPAAIAAR